MPDITSAWTGNSQINTYGEYIEHFVEFETQHQLVGTIAEADVAFTLGGTGANVFRYIEVTDFSRTQTANLDKWLDVGGDYELDDPPSAGFGVGQSTSDWADHYLAPAGGGSVNWSAMVAIKSGTSILSPTDDDIPGDLIQEIVSDGISYVAIGDANMLNFDRNDVDSPFYKFIRNCIEKPVP